jgi:hypothetical protein
VEETFKENEDLMTEIIEMTEETGETGEIGETEMIEEEVINDKERTRAIRTDRLLQIFGKPL